MDRIQGNPLVSRVLEVCVRELGAVELANRLGVTPVLLDLWRQGKSPVPHRDVRALVDVLIALDPGWEDWDRA